MVEVEFGLTATYQDFVYGTSSGFDGTKTFSSSVYNEYT